MMTEAEYKRYHENKMARERVALMPPDRYRAFRDMHNKANREYYQRNRERILKKKAAWYQKRKLAGKERSDA